MARIVYMLGAGASAQAIPIVSNMLLRMEFFLFCLEVEIKRLNKPNEQVIERLESYANILHKASKHLSIDTYAKKLYLLDETILLLHLRELISLYFLFEHYHLTAYDNYIDSFIQDYESHESEKENIRTLLLKYSRKQLDPRYDSFIAGISNKYLVNNLFLPQNVSIVSWNYDLQLEKAISVYDRFNSKRLDYFYNPLEYHKQDIILEFSNEFIKLNGSSGHKLLNEEDLQDKDLFDSECRTNIEAYEIDPKGYSLKFSYIFNLLSEYTASKNINNLRPYINFAWEENKISKSNINRALQKFSEADSIIIIGYSFPTFNREIDCLLFSNLDLGENCKIYVQTVDEKEFINTRTRILGISKGISEKDIEFIDDISQFYIPFEFSRDVGKRRIVTSFSTR